MPTGPAQTTPTPTTPGGPPTPTGAPDLVITDLTTSTFTVKNQGNAAAGPFTVTVAGFMPPVRLTEGLAAGASETRTFGSGCFAGDYTATADSLEEVAESSEVNNTKTITVFC